MKRINWRLKKVVFLASLIFWGLLFVRPSLGFEEGLLPLFQEEEPIKITIIAPLNDLIKTSRTEIQNFPASLILHEGESEQTFAINLSPRGKSRRTLGFCSFPPLKVDLKKKEVPDTLFHGQNKLKLVTHCRGSDRYQDFYIKEYAIYRAYKVLTPFSLRVRMAKVTYIDSISKRDPETKLGFFIEDIDDLAERLGMEELEVEKIGTRDLEPRQATIYAVFQFLIGNLDWSNIRGSEGEECCHNTKLIARGAVAGENPVYPIPYDFDFSGLVDAPYAVPPENLSFVRNVRQRLFRGYCQHNEYLEEVVALFLEKEEALRAVFRDEALMDDKEKKQTENYLDDFFETLKDPGKVERDFAGKCVS